MRISDWSQTCALPISIRDESHQRQRLAARILRRAEYAAHPDGFHLWLKVPEPWSRAGFTEYLRASGIGVVASDAFVVGIQAPEAVRICLGGPMSRVECGHWLEIIEDTVGQMPARSEEHTSELQSLMRISYAVFCLKKKNPHS